MTSIGPTLPPHLAGKRKRNEDDNVQRHSVKVYQRTCGPSLPPSSIEIRDNQSDEDEKNSIGPSWPDSLSGARDGSSILPIEPSLIQTSQPSTRGGPAKVLGPSLPPADISERPAMDGTMAESTDSDDDFGPALPGNAPLNHSTSDRFAESTETPSEAVQKTGRDEWMLAPPSGSDRTSRIDPSKMKNRSFISGKGSRPTATSSGDMSLWTETPEEKRKRLEEEMLGVRKASQPQNKDSESARKEAEAIETAKKVKAYNEKNRAAPLYSAKAHQADEDDPSKRAFDREKDIGGSKLSHTEQKQLLNRAADFGSRFSKGSYL